MTPEQQAAFNAGMEALKVLQQLPAIVLIFLVVSGFILVIYRTQSTQHVQAETVKENTIRGIKAQEENNRLSAGLQVALNSIMTLYTQSTTAMNNQTTAMERQSGALNTMDASLSSLPKLASSAQGTDANVSLAVAMLKVMGVNIQDINRAQGLLGVDMKIIAQFLDNPTAANKQDVQDIANKPAAEPAPELPPAPAPEPVAAVPTTVEVALPVTLVAAAEVPAG